MGRDEGREEERDERWLVLLKVFPSLLMLFLYCME